MNTASLNSNSLAPPGTPVAALQNAQIQADMQQYAASNGGNSSGPPGSVSNVSAPAVHSSAPAPAPAPAVAPHAVAVGQERSARGGYLRRASGGAASVAHIPTNELIQYALDRIRQRRNAANGGTQSVPTGSWEIGNSSDNHNANTLSGGTYFTQVPTASSAPTAAPSAPAPTNTPAIASGTVGNHGGIGSPGFNSSAPLGGIPIAMPNGQATNSTDPGGPQYNNSIDQALQTNNPTSDQVFGFTYPTIPPPKPQPVGPVPQSLINGEFGVGFGSQTGTGSEFFRAGGAVIMDAALNKARKAIKGNKRYV